LQASKVFLEADGKSPEKMCHLSFVLGWQRINRSEMLALLLVGKKI
jgi:hypothetical protein